VNKHERAVELIRARKKVFYKSDAEALTYALRVLEAVDREIHPDTVEWLADMGFTEEAFMIQAIVDAKAGTGT